MSAGVGSIAGVAAREVRSPGSAAELGEILAAAARDKLCVALSGGGTKLGLGAPPQQLDLLVRTRGMKRILEYAPADMVLIAEAGATLAELQSAAREHRQQLALDPPFFEQATLGGIIATGDSGPRRARYGTVKDLIIGAVLVRADGVLAKSGGKVVKNVAGFDLPKLVCGSLGTLAAIATATFRLHPLPESEATVLAAPPTAAAVHELVIKLREAQLEPSCAVALRAGGRWELAFRFEGFEAGVREQCAQAERLCQAQRLAAGDARALWARHQRIRETGAVRLKLTVLPSRFAALEPLLAPLGGELALYPSLGIAHLSGESIDPSAISAARAAAESRGGALVVEAMPDALRPALEPWGARPPAFALMEQLKARFDPERRFNRGRFVGGI